MAARPYRHPATVPLAEADSRGGSLNTARHASELGRPLMAVPGPVTSEQSAGTNALVSDGRSRRITNAKDIVNQKTLQWLCTGLNVACAHGLIASRCATIPPHAYTFPDSI